MDADEFEKEYSAEKPDDFPDEPGGEELLLQQDIVDALTLLRRVKRLLDYVSDPVLCKTVTKRERNVMEVVAGDVTEFLDSTAGNYEGEE